MTKQKRLLITGGCGFIGSGVVKECLQRGHNVCVIDNYTSGDKKALGAYSTHENLSLIQADIRDKDAVEALIYSFAPQQILHFAAQKSVTDSVNDPQNDVEQNLIGLLNLLLPLKNHKIERFIFSSSGGALARKLSEEENSKEDEMPQFSSPYAISKFAGEQYVRLYAGLFGFDFALLRYANVYGQKAVCDDVVSIIIDELKNGKSVKLYADSSCPDGGVRDFIYIDDVVRANLLAIEGKLFGTLNIASGIGTSVRSLFALLETLCGRKCPMTILPPRDGEIIYSVLDNSRAGVLGFTPKYSLADGLQKMLANK